MDEDKEYQEALNMTLDGLLQDTSEWYLVEAFKVIEAFDFEEGGVGQFNTVYEDICIQIETIGELGAAQSACRVLSRVLALAWYLVNTGRY